MKIITWNCNMAFRKKANFILSLNPDILIVPECEHPDKLKFPAETPKPTDFLWFGTNQNKGLGIFSYSENRFEVLDNHLPELRMIIPIAVTGGKIDFNLFAIWANNPDDKDGQYVEQVWKAVNFYHEILAKNQTILVGDFNSNVIWDKTHRIGNHSNVVKLLEEKGIQSTYHVFHRQIQGLEKHPTLFMYRHKEKPYHIDYCFASKYLIEKLQSVEVGAFDSWIQHSDHMPLIVSFKVN
ncbi:MAG: endonuclease/exonuclease/phosphatase family protein [Prolixibacteraceae bacterium]|nr:endonuclease/exonuclease/phosphatase family protein [Prolixibacteraceae bacterium]